MDLGISGRVALVAASSQGLGLACATSLAQEGVRVTLNGRDDSRLEAAAARLRRAVPGAEVGVVTADLTTPEGRGRIVAALPEVDILVTNNAGPRPGPYSAWDADALHEALAQNAVPAVELMRAYLPGMRARRFGRIVNITSAMVKSPAADMGLSASARAALTAAAKSISKEVAADNVTVNNLLPERIDTPRQEFMARRRMERDGITRDEAYAAIAATVTARRLGRPEELGDACAFLCSAQAGYITGQNLQLDGGTYEGLI
ncbi:SDR family oxidoreductase [Demequina lignilytica]|uniref:SDR family oxidoreductase n=1 Tax=Demequina lignilytica TaxID=3051663 RepID=A0AB35MGR2_9MICO|nr:MULTISPECIES: SDR family oxidoreductase [unclassified Demequina]MDN4482982.1 SDR family oxidoreductase [Demequina sp. SYSU T0a273]MDN4491438.1 SDR family oxidoreductase [Demequina sp. SYSU T00068]